MSSHASVSSSELPAACSLHASGWQQGRVGRPWLFLSSFYSQLRMSQEDGHCVCGC